MNKVIFKNSIWLFSAQAVTKVTSFFYTVFLARSLGVENFGLYIAALSYFSLISAIADFGVSRYLIREISKNTKNTSIILPTTVLLRFLLLLTSVMVFTLGVYISDKEIARRNLTILAALAVLPQSISLTLDAIFVALLRIKYSAIGIICSSLFTVLSGVVLVTFGLNSIGAILALLLGQVVYAGFMLIISIRQKVNWLGKIRKELVLDIFKGSLPYGLLGILGLLYFKIDSLLLVYMKGSYDTGVYGAAYKFLEAIIFIPSAFSAAAFPLLARYHENNTKKVQEIYQQSIKMLLAVSLVVTLGYIILIPYFIETVLPQYKASIISIKILSFTIPFMFLQAPAVLTLLSTDKYLKSVIVISLVTITLNICMNLLLIPTYSYIGSSLVTVLSELLSFVVFYLFLKFRVFKI